jgi:rare lipoprotein A
MKAAFCINASLKTARGLVGVAIVLALSSFGGDVDKATKVAEAGIASYYGAEYHGKRTASGEIYDMRQLTAAHPRYSFGTRLKVTHSGNNRSVIVRINDRGPFTKGRVIDLSQAAAEELQMVKSGLAEVKVELIQ